MLIRRNGNFIEFVVGGVTRVSINRTCTANLSNTRRSIQLIDINGFSTTIYVDTVKELQVLPSAVAPFSGTIVDLWETLLADFLNELHANGAPPPIPNPEENFVLVNGSYSVSVSAEPTMNDQNVIATGALTATLPPAVSDVFGIPITICANSNDVTILPDGTDLILSDISCEIAGLDSITLICFQVGKWIAK